MMLSKYYIWLKQKLKFSSLLPHCKSTWVTTKDHCFAEVFGEDLFLSEMGFLIFLTTHLDLS